MASPPSAELLFSYTRNTSIAILTYNIPTFSIENTTIHVKFDNQELCLSAVYKRPAATFLTNDIHSLLDTLINTLIAGNLNAKHSTWNSHQNNSSGIIISQYINSCNDSSIIATITPTHYPHNHNHNSDILDIAVMKIGNMTFQLENLTSELSSDHTPIVLDLCSKAVHLSSPNPSKVSIGRNSK